MLKRWRRRRWRAATVPHEWIEIVHRNVPYTNMLGDADRAELLSHMQVLLHEKRFEGCDGLVMVDEIRVTIAAQAAVLLLHRQTDYFPTIRTILVYPGRYLAPRMARNADGTVSERVDVRAGEYSSWGTLVLSWDDALKGALDIHDGRNVVLHEFAHALDAESGSNEGAPDLGTGARYTAWAQVLSRDFESFCVSSEHRSDPSLDPYGASSPAEFFAVATEFFFERPSLLRSRHPELYDQLASYYAQDPAALMCSDQTARREAPGRFADRGAHSAEHNTELR